MSRLVAASRRLPLVPRRVSAGASPGIRVEFFFSADAVGCRLGGHGMGLDGLDRDFGLDGLSPGGTQMQNKINNFFNHVL